MNQSSYGIYQTAGSLTVASSSIYGQSTGIYQSGGSSFVHASSTIRNNTNGIFLAGVDGLAYVASNLIKDNSNYGVYISDANDVIDVNVNYIDGNTYGVYVGNGTATTTKISANHILNNDYGVYVNGGNALIASNIIEGNSTYGVYNNAGSLVPGEYNYWGASDGPSGNGGGSGDVVSTNVVYLPYLTEPHYIQMTPSGDPDKNSVDSLEDMEWDGDLAPYNDQWNDAVAIWENYSSEVDITDSAPLAVDLNIATTSLEDVIWIGRWVWDWGDPDTLEVNAYQMDRVSDDAKVSVIAHELGHALGLDHSYLGNLMNYSVAEQIGLGPQDQLDYNFCWVDNNCQ